MRRRLSAALAAASLAALTAACGHLTAGGLSETTVSVSGDAPDAVAAPAAGAPVAPTPAAGAPAGPSLQDDDDEIEGEIEADFLLFLDRLDGPSIQLTDQEIQVELDVGGMQEATVVQRTIPSGRYSALRVVFSEIEVEIDAGLVIDGRPITGLVSVDVEIEGLTVVRSVVLDLDDGESQELLIDLNTPTWLAAVDPDRLEVTGQAFADAITVRVR